MKQIARAGLFFAPLGRGASGAGQERDAKAAVPEGSWPARAADVATVDGVMAALYEVVSGPAGEARDWDRLRSLFTPDGKMGAVDAGPGGAFALRAMTIEDYIARTAKPFSEAGFFESEMARTADIFGQITQVFSTYEARKAPADAKPFMRGVNSLQMYHDGSRWWIVSLLWRAEDEKLSLPEKYLKSH